MLLLAGVDMDGSSPASWLAHAHTTARFVTGGCCAAAPPPPWPTQQQLHDSTRQPQQQQTRSGLENGHSSSGNGVCASSNGSQPQQQPARQQQQAQILSPAPAQQQGEADSLGQPSGNAAQRQQQQGAVQRPSSISPVAVRRWVLTQKVLVEQRRLSSAQFRYLTMLGEL